jgi:hypothetical protein
MRGRTLLGDIDMLMEALLSVGTINVIPAMKVSPTPFC